MVPITDLNPRRPHVTRQEIYTLIPHTLNYSFSFLFLLIYLFTCLFLSYFIVPIWLLLSLVVILYQGISFVHGYMRSSQIPIFTSNQLKRSHTKQVLKLHILCNYVSKENSYEALPKSRCCSVITLSCFNK